MGCVIILLTFGAMVACFFYQSRPSGKGYGGGRAKVRPVSRLMCDQQAGRRVRVSGRCTVKSTTYYLLDAVSEPGARGQKAEQGAFLL